MEKQILNISFSEVTQEAINKGIFQLFEDQDIETLGLNCNCNCGGSNCNCNCSGSNCNCNCM